MNIQAQVQHALGVMRATIPGANAAIRLGSISGSALRMSGRATAELDGPGEQGLTTSRVFLSRATFAVRPGLGQTIEIAGSPCIMTAIADDPTGAMWIIDYQATRPLVGA